MGGNAKAVYRNTGTVKIYENRLVYAEKIPFSEVEPDVLVADVQELIKSLNRLASKPIWSKPSLDNSTMFFGSFDCLREISDKQEFVSKKSGIGDVDVAVPDVGMQTLHDVLVAHEEKNVTPSFMYIGQNRAEFSGKKLNSVFLYRRCDKFLQIDFEGMKFVNEKPLPYVKFMRSSPWIDLKEGLKGLSHKYLLVCIARVVSYRDNIVILTDKSPVYPPNKVRIKLLDELPHSLSFSKEGLRDKLVQQKHLGYPVMVEGKYAYKQLATKDSPCEADLKKIFKRLFSREPMAADLNNFCSFMGCLELCSQYFSRTKIQSIYEYMVTVKMFGNGQALSRDLAQEDKDIKTRIISRMESKFPYLKGTLPLEDLIEEYYSSYEEREVE
jgi:hypothetical protein